MFSYALLIPPLFISRKRCHYFQVLASRNISVVLSGVQKVDLWFRAVLLFHLGLMFGNGSDGRVVY